MGMEVNAKTRKSFLSKYPARMNLYDAMRETTMLSVSETGFMDSTGKDSSAITARYPEAPAWPTEEYRNEISRNRRLQYKIISDSMRAR